MCIVHSIVTNRLETDMTYESTTRQCNRLVNRYTVGVQENILEYGRNWDKSLKSFPPWCSQSKMV
jgi:hypothetical protein